MRLNENIGLAQQPDGHFIFLDLGFLVELVELQLRGGFGAKAHMHKPGLAVEFQQFAVAINIGHARIDAPFHFVRQAACDQFLAEFDEFLAIDGGFFIRQNEETDTMIFNEILDLVDDVFGIAHAIIAPEFPL